MELVLNIIGIPQGAIKKAFLPFVSFGRHLADHFIPHARNNYHPHILGHRALALFSGLLVTIKIFTLAILFFGPVVPAFSSAITSENIIILTNESRQQFGLATLSQNAALAEAAQNKANDMLAKGYFAHNTPDGKTPWDFIIAAGYNYMEAGENLAVNFTEAESVENAWMNSPGHKANILNRNFEEIGVGIAQGQYQGHNAIFVVQEFGTPSSQKVVLSSAPTPVVKTQVPSPLITATEISAPAGLSQNSTLPKTSAKKQPAVQQIRSASSPNAKSLATEQTVQPDSEPVIFSGQVNVERADVVILATANSSVVKMLAYFGQQAVMLSPKSNGSWQTQVPLSILTQKGSTVRLVAEDMTKRQATMQLADFAPSAEKNYNLAATSPVVYASFLNQNFNVKSAETRFYLIFMAGLLTSLIIAIGVKRHIQHLSLIANSSFVILLAALLLWTG